MNEYGLTLEFHLKSFKCSLMRGFVNIIVYKS